MKILVPVDFSPSSKKALQFAEQIALALEGKLVLMHIIEPVGGDVAFVADYDQMIEEAKNNLKTFRKGLDVVVETMVEVGFPPERIIDKVSEEKISLVVMGMESDMSHLDRDVFGSNAYDVIKKGKCAVLTVPADSKPRDLKKMMLAVELQRKENVFMLSFIKRIIKHYDARLYLVHVTKNTNVDLTKTNNDAILWLRDQLKSIDHEFVTINDDRIAEALNFYAEDEKMGMMVLSPVKQSFFMRLLKGSTTRKTVLHTHVPVLTFPEDY